MMKSAATPQGRSPSLYDEQLQRKQQERRLVPASSREQAPATQAAVRARIAAEERQP
jgi:hypothetical protein